MRVLCRKVSRFCLVSALSRRICRGQWQVFVSWPGQGFPADPESGRLGAEDRVYQGFGVLRR